MSARSTPRFVPALLASMLVASAQASAAEDCSGIIDKLEKKIGDKIIDNVEKHWADNGVKGFAKPVGTFMRDLAASKNDQGDWDAAVDFYFDGPLDAIPGFLKNGWRDKIKGAFAEFNGMDLDGAAASGGCGGKGADDAAKGSRGAGKRVDPLLVDLDGKGVTFVPASRSRAYFDLGGEGFATRTAWVEPNVGFLAVDQNFDGMVNNIGELFGSAAVDGFTELAQYDGNKDGRIDRDEMLRAKLLVWTDTNQDGVSQASELLSAVGMGFIEISLKSEPVSRNDADGRVLSKATYLRGNGGGTVYDVDFLTLPTFSRYVGSLGASDDAPTTAHEKRIAPTDDGKSVDVRGYGRLPSLSVAMQERPELRDALDALLREKDAQHFRDQFEGFLYRWAGVGEVTVAELDATPALKADANGTVNFSQAKVRLSLKQLAFVKAYTGLDRLALGDGAWRENGRIVYTGNLYAEAWRKAHANLLAKLAVRSGLVDNARYGLRYRIDSDYLYSTALPDDGQTVAKVLEDVLSSSSERRFRGVLAGIAFGEISEVTRRKFAARLAREMSRQPYAALPDAMQNPMLSLLVDVRLAGEGTLEGGMSDAILVAAPKGSVLKAGVGNDVLVGSSGDDRMLVGGKSTTVVLQSNGGTDRVEGTCRDGRHDRVLMPQGALLGLDGNHLVVRAADGSGRLMLEQCFSSGRSPKSLQFETPDGAVVDYAKFLRALPPVFAGPNEALFTALGDRSIAKVELLVAGGVDVNGKNRWGERPVLVAAGHGRVELLEALMARGDLDFNGRSGDGRTALHRAASGGENAMLTRLLAIPGITVNARDDYGASALHAAVKYGNLQTVEILLRSGADVNAQDKYGDTPVHAAAQLSRKEALLRLVSMPGVRLSLKNSNGKTAYETAPKEERQTIAFAGGGESFFATSGRFVVRIHQWLDAYGRRVARR